MRRLNIFMLLFSLDGCQAARDKTIPQEVTTSVNQNSLTESDDKSFLDLENYSTIFDFQDQAARVQLNLDAVPNIINLFGKPMKIIPEGSSKFQIEEVDLEKINVELYSGETGYKVTKRGFFRTTKTYVPMNEFVGKPGKIRPIDGSGLHYYSLVRRLDPPQLGILVPGKDGPHFISYEKIAATDAIEAMKRFPTAPGSESLIVGKFEITNQLESQGWVVRGGLSGLEKELLDSTHALTAWQEGLNVAQLYVAPPNGNYAFVFKRSPFLRHEEGGGGLVQMKVIERISINSAERVKRGIVRSGNESVDFLNQNGMGDNNLQITSTVSGSLSTGAFIQTLSLKSSLGSFNAVISGRPILVEGEEGDSLAQPTLMWDLEKIDRNSKIWSSGVGTKTFSYQDILTESQKTPN